jgi:hypothetical protein
VRRCLEVVLKEEAEHRRCGERRAWALDDGRVHPRPRRGLPRLRLTPELTVSQAAAAVM